MTLLMNSSTHKKKTILFIYDHLYLGGIETLIIRCSKWLLDRGYNVKLILRAKGDLFASLDPRVQVKVYGIVYSLFFTPVTGRLIFGSSYYRDIDFIYTFRPEGLWIASVLAKVKKKRFKVLNCVYHPWEFYIRGHSHYHTTSFSKILLSSFPKTNLAFMNQECQIAHEEYFGTKFNNSFIFPLPVTGVPDYSQQRTPLNYKIVSIGSLKSFRPYNLFMIDIISDLIKSGFEVTYEIYGEGELRPLMEKKIKDLNLEKSVQLRGNLAYHNYYQALKEAYLFVGVGTAAIEAGFGGVPTIVPLGKSPLSSVSYGYLYELPKYNVGETTCDIQEKDVKELIIKLLKMSKEEYLSECTKTRNYVSIYNMTQIMSEFVAKIEDPECFRQHSFSDLPNSIYYEYCANKLAYKVRRLSHKLAAAIGL